MAFVCVGASVFAYTGHLRIEALGVPHLDLLGHFLLIGLLAFFADGLLGHRALTPMLRAGPLLVLTAAATDEVLQRLSRHRHSTWSDFVADVLGVALASYAAAVQGATTSSREGGVTRQARRRRIT